MCEKLVAFKEWCENTDCLGFWFGFFTAAILIMIVLNLPPLESTTAPMAEISPSFDDVPDDHWAYEEIELIKSYGVTVGCSYDPPLYCPERPMTRAEAAVFAARILEIIEQSP